jgi:hypothetical protein
MEGVEGRKAAGFPGDLRDRLLGTGYSGKVISLLAQFYSQLEASKRLLQKSKSDLRSCAMAWDLDLAAIGSACAAGKAAAEEAYEESLDLAAALRKASDLLLLVARSYGDLGGTNGQAEADSRSPEPVRRDGPTEMREDGSWEPEQTTGS